jgi:hypothetical protein
LAGGTKRNGRSERTRATSWACRVTDRVGPWTGQRTWPCQKAPFATRPVSCFAEGFPWPWSGQPGGRPWLRAVRPPGASATILSTLAGGPPPQPTAKAGRDDRGTSQRGTTPGGAAVVATHGSGAAMAMPTRLRCRGTLTVADDQHAHRPRHLWQSESFFCFARRVLASFSCCGLRLCLFLPLSLSLSLSFSLSVFLLYARCF